MTQMLTIPVAFGFYLLLAGQLGVEQLVSATVMTGIAVIWSTLIRRNGSTRRYRFSMDHLKPWLRAIAAIPPDTARVGRAVMRAALFGGSPGRSVRAPYRFGTNTDPADAARRATAVLAGSLTPDTFVVDIAPHRSDARCHKLTRIPAPANPEWLV